MARRQRAGTPPRAYASICRSPANPLSSRPHIPRPGPPSLPLPACRELAAQELFTHERWAKHRSTQRYARHVAGTVQSRVLAGLAQPLGGVAAFAASICLYEDALKGGALPAGLPTFLLPALPFDVTGGLLSLLLVFRWVRWCHGGGVL